MVDAGDFSEWGDIDRPDTGAGVREQKCTEQVLSGADLQSRASPEVVRVKGVGFQDLIRDAEVVAVRDPALQESVQGRDSREGVKREALQSPIHGSALTHQLDIPRRDVLRCGRFVGLLFGSAIEHGRV